MHQDNRNSYIDFIKFVFAIIIVMFHVSPSTHVFEGGRIAVEGFFMISGYLMLLSLNRQKPSDNKVGQATLSFLYHKWVGLLPYLIASLVCAYCIDMLLFKTDFKAHLAKMPLLLFELFPTQVEGFRGVYYLGISWYISSMFLALAILYPLCKKYGSDFTFIFAVPLTMVLYGSLSYKFGHLATCSDWLTPFINSGMIRGLAGCLLGCLLYEFSKLFSTCQFSKHKRQVLHFIELGCYFLFFFIIQQHPKSVYEYVSIFVIFSFLLIGLTGLSVLEIALSKFNTKWLGTCSTLFVLNHFFT